MRVCRLENVGELVLTVARPLYHGWGNFAALEEIRSLILKTSSVSTGTGRRNQHSRHAQQQCSASSGFCQTHAASTQSDGY